MLLVAIESKYVEHAGFFRVVANLHVLDASNEGEAIPANMPVIL
jgi:hypothetical protein